MNQIFTLKQVREKVKEKNQRMVEGFRSLKKTYGKINCVRDMYGNSFVS